MFAEGEVTCESPDRSLPALAFPVIAMTDDTKNALQQATLASTAARAEADLEKGACLAQIEMDLRARAAGAAR